MCDNYCECVIMYICKYPVFDIGCKYFERNEKTNKCKYLQVDDINYKKCNNEDARKEAREKTK